METIDKVLVRQLGRKPYQPVWASMQQFTGKRDDDTLDEIWLLEHPSVYTLGRNGNKAHVVSPGKIPVVQIDRGGQVTYHGPGQLVAYLMINIKRRSMGARKLVSIIEQGVIDLLKEYHLTAYADPKAPGVYIDKKKIAALGLRIKRGCSYHGLSLNLDMDMKPFEGIHPCGYKDLKMTQLADFVNELNINDIKQQLIKHICQLMSYKDITWLNKQIEI